MSIINGLKVHFCQKSRVYLNKSTYLCSRSEQSDKENVNHKAQGNKQYFSVICMVQAMTTSTLIYYYII